MKQTIESGSGIISEMAFGAITGITFVRKLISLTILLVVITVAMGSFMIWMMFRGDFSGESAPALQAAPLAPEPKRNRQSKPPPSKRDDGEEIQRLIRKNPL